MPAKSKKQQQFMGIVHSVQKGETDPEDVSPEARKVAKSMDPEDVTDYAETKHKGLPTKVKKEVVERAILRHIIREEIRAILERDVIPLPQRQAVRSGETNNVKRAKSFLMSLSRTGMSFEDIKDYIVSKPAIMKLYGKNNIAWALASMMK